VRVCVCMCLHVCVRMCVCIITRVIFQYRFLTATVGPTVVNPCAFAFQSRGYGINKAIASLLVVASSVDNIIPVTGFAVLLVLLGDEG